MSPPIGYLLVLLIIVAGLSVLWMEIDHVHTHVSEIKKQLKVRTELANAEREITEISHQTRHAMLDSTLEHLAQERNQ